MATPIEIPESHADLFRRPLVAPVTTIGADGQPQSTPVWYLVDDDGVLKTSTTTSRQKYKNLARNPRATLLIIDPEDTNRCEVSP
jgi:PPOX class probable F420-dependent enzyme